MTLKELKNNIDRIVETKGATYALFRHIKANPDLMLDFNRKQLFDQGVGADGKHLGSYSLNRDPESDKRKEPGQVFTMIDTGLFKQGLRLKTHYRKIIITSPYHTNAMLKNPNFNTTEFFRLIIA